MDSGDGGGHGRRRMSVMNREPVEGLSTTNPNIRRMSRMEPRPSVQYGYSGRRMSQFSRSSISGMSFTGHKGLFNQVKVQNTYRLAPEHKERFNPCHAEDIIKGVLQSYIEGEKYDKLLCPNLVTDISAVIKDRMKDSGFSPRYKYICQVIIGENKNQGVSVASRCLWASDVDNFASASFAKGDIMCVATVFATYFE